MVWRKIGIAVTCAFPLFMIVRECIIYAIHIEPKQHRPMFSKWISAVEKSDWAAIRFTDSNGNLLYVDDSNNQILLLVSRNDLFSSSRFYQHLGTTKSVFGTDEGNITVSALPDTLQVALGTNQRFSFSIYAGAANRLMLVARTQSGSMDCLGVIKSLLSDPDASRLMEAVAQYVTGSKKSTEPDAGQYSRNGLSASQPSTAGTFGAPER